MHNECTHDVTHEFMFDYSTHETSRSFDDVENIIIRNIDQGARQLHIVHETGEVIMLRERNDHDAFDMSNEYARIDAHVFVVIDTREAHAWEQDRASIDVIRARVRAFVALHVVTMTCNEYWR